MPPPSLNNLELIIKNLKRFNISIVIPTRDGELLFWSKYKTKFKNNGIHIIVNEYNKIKLCNDKLKFYKFCKLNSILTPEIYDINKKNHKKIIIKEKFGSSKNIIIFNLKENFQKKIAHFTDPIIQEFIKGIEISVDVWINNSSKKIYYISRKRDLIINGESQITSIFKNNKLDKILTKVLNKLNFKGPFMLQLIKSNNNFYLLECNSRIGGASTFSMHNGLDMIYWSLIEALKIQKNHKIEFNNNNLYTKQIRYPNDMYEKNYNI